MPTGALMFGGRRALRWRGYIKTISGATWPPPFEILEHSHIHMENVVHYFDKGNIWNISIKMNLKSFSHSIPLPFTYIVFDKPLEDIYISVILTFVSKNCVNPYPAPTHREKLIEYKMYFRRISFKLEVNKPLFWERNLQKYLCDTNQGIHNINRINCF